MIFLGLLLTVLAGVPQKASAWGVRGHDAIAYIAEMNLNPETKAIVERYLGGKSIVYYSVFLDQMRFIADYSFYYREPSHAAEYSKDYKSLGRTGEVVDALREMTESIARLENGQYKALPDSVVTLAIQCFIHQMGDVHCPVHMVVKDRDGRFSVTSNGHKSSFHDFWDDMPAKAHQWHYLEYGHQLSRLTPEQVAENTKGSLYDWGEAAVIECIPLWDAAIPHGELGKPYIYKFTPLMEDMLTKAGYRLAFVLNKIFK